MTSPDMLNPLARDRNQVYLYFGSKIYGLDPKNGFAYCVIAITIVYALILPCLKLIPKNIMSTADGEELAFSA